MKKLKLLSLLTFLPLLLLAPLNVNGDIISRTEPSASIHVPDDFATIQEAINNATPGDMIFVSSGLYHERVVINKTVMLVGENRETTIVDGGFAGSVFQITADNVSVTGFKLQNTGWKWGRSGVEVYNADYCEIKGNFVFLTCHQIRLNCSRGSKIIGNIVSAPTRDPFPRSAYGIRLENSADCLIENNTVSNNIGGIHLQNTTNCTVIRNLFFQNSQGIRLYSPCVDNKIVANTVCNNTSDGMIEAMPRNQTLIGNSFVHNNFVNNSQPFIYKVAGCIWDDGFEGNYWARYNGSDLDRDGIGDMPYDVGLDQDQYPLMGIFASFNTSKEDEVNVISNSTIESFEFFEANNTIRIRVSNSTITQKFGFCRVLIPHALMLEPYNVTIDGANPTYWNYSVYDDGKNRVIYFTYEHSALEITIVQEFPVILTTLFVMATLVAVAVCKQKRCLRRRG